MKPIQVIKYFFILSLIFFSRIGFSQFDKVYISTKDINQNMADILKEVEKKVNKNIFFEGDSLQNILISDFTVENQDSILLTEYLKHKAYKISEYQSSIFLSKHGKINTKLPESYYKTKNYGLYNTDKPENSKYLSSEEEYISRVRNIGEKDYDNKEHAVFYGKVMAFDDNTVLQGAFIKVKNSPISTKTDILGNYKLSLKKGKHIITVTSPEIENTSIEINLYSDGELNIYPERTYVSIEEVTIYSETHHNVKSLITGFEELSVSKSADIPSSLGENDLIKAGLLLPGVQTIGEGNAGINVRGAPADQNMFLLDGLPLYNTSHFLGFFSSFNPLAIKNLSIYKSSIPIEYGNNLSSVFDIQVKEGLKNKFSSSINLSPITFGILAEGPIIKDKASFLLGYRTTYSNWILKLINNLDINQSRAEFKDIIANLSFKLNDKNKIKILGYYSDDNINLSGRNEYDYKVKGIKFSWNKILYKKHNINTNILYSNYLFNESNKENVNYQYTLPYKLEHFGFNLKLNFHLNNHDLTIGTDNILFMIDQGSIKPYDSNSLIVPTDLYTENALLSAIYISESWKINDIFSVKAALRLNSYHYLGERSIYTYEENQVYSPEFIIDTINYKNFERIKSFLHPDFRLTANYKLSNNISIKAGYSNMYQYLFMMSNTISASPTNKFKLVDQYLDPINGQQYNLGFYSNILNNRYILSVESYYKKIKKYKDFKDGANLIYSKIPEFDILNGKMNIYGIELMLKKVAGKFKGWINYTYSNSSVSVEDGLNDLRLNNGEPYPSNFDKPHSLNIVSNYKLNRRLSFSGNIVYSKGRPLTMPIGFFYQYDIQIPFYSKRNEYRIPDYFRIDLSARIEGNLKKNKIAHGTWIISVYNLTGRNNVYSLYFKTDDNGGRMNGYKMSIFAIPIFSVSYQIKYGNYADKYL